MAPNQAADLAMGKSMPEPVGDMFYQYKGEHSKLYQEDKFFEINQLFLIFGGFGFPEYRPPRTDITEQAATMPDMWVYHINQCVKNCSLHGDCIHGRCFCHDGYYGEDCSNSTCPGSFCYY